MAVSERIPFSGLLLPLQKGYTYVFVSFNSIMVGVLMVAIVITSTGATFGVLMTLFSFANCLGDIVLCIIPFFLRKKYPHAPFEAREAEGAAMDAGK